MENPVFRNSSSGPATNATTRSPEENKFRHSTEETLIFVFIYTILAFLVIIGNSLIMIAFKRNHKLRTSTNFFFMSLAVSDLLVGAISIPSWVYLLLYDLKNPFPSAANLQFRKAYLFLDVFSALTSIANLTAVTIERNVAISKPLRHRTIPRFYYFIAIAATWIYGLVIAGVFVADFESFSWRKNRGLLSTTAGFLAPLFVITYLYADIYKKVKLFSFRQRSHCPNLRNKKKNQERTTAKTVLIVTTLFVLSWLPFFTVSVLYIFCPRRCLPRGKNLMHLVDFVKILHYGNSAINPVIYALRSTDIRTTLSRILVRCLMQVTASSVRATPLTAGTPLVPVNGEQ